MTIDAVWQELEAELALNTSGSWLTRHARPSPGVPLVAAFERSTRARALLVPEGAAGSLPLRPEWPECLGLELFRIDLEGTPHFGVRLRNNDFREVFSALAEDVAVRVESSPPERAALALIDRLRRWQRFLSASREGLGPEQQRGLWAELHVLGRRLIHAKEPYAAVDAWKGPHGAHQDFQLVGGAIEVKATTAKRPQAVRITSERQLDGTGCPALMLLVLILDEREAAGAGAVGQSLAEAVAALRLVLASSPAALDLFNDRLLDAGWLDAHAHRYDLLRWTVRSEHCYHVAAAFPRITEQMLPQGIGNVSYDLSLSVCEAFSIAPADAIKMVTLQH